MEIFSQHFISFPSVILTQFRSLNIYLALFISSSFPRCKTWMENFKSTSFNPSENGFFYTRSTSLKLSILIRASLSAFIQCLCCSVYLIRSLGTCASPFVSVFNNRVARLSLKTKPRFNRNHVLSAFYRL